MEAKFPVIDIETLINGDLFEPQFEKYIRSVMKHIGLSEELGQVYDLAYDSGHSGEEFHIYCERYKTFLRDNWPESP